MTDIQEIVARHGGMVYGVCRRALGNVQEAEDAAQTVFLTFLEKAPTLGRDTVLASWLHRTAVYVSSNQIRSRIRRDQALPPPPAPQAAAERAWDEAKPHLDGALARLPGRLQEAIVVHYLQGKTLGETAATLGCPVKTLEKRVGRGLEILRRLLSRAGVAISSAALVALLQSEARAAAPQRLLDALRGRPVPLPRPGSRSRRCCCPLPRRCWSPRSSREPSGWPERTGTGKRPRSSGPPGPRRPHPPRRKPHRRRSLPTPRRPGRHRPIRFPPASTSLPRSSGSWESFPRRSTAGRRSGSTSGSRIFGW